MQFKFIFLIRLPFNIQICDFCKVNPISFTIKVEQTDEGREEFSRKLCSHCAATVQQTIESVIDELKEMKDDKED